MKVLAVTLARQGSKGIKNKNIKEIAGKPLIQWTYEQVMLCENVTSYVISTDIPEVHKTYENSEAMLIARPPELAQDDTPSIDALQHAVRSIEYELGGERYDIIADIRCTSPLKTAADIDAAIQACMHSGHPVVGATLTQPVERIKTMYGGFLMDTYPEPLDGQRQFLRSYYIRNGTFYILPRDELMEEGRLLGNGFHKAFIMPRERSVNIDDEFDWMVAECLLTR